MSLNSPRQYSPNGIGIYLKTIFNANFSGISWNCLSLADLKKNLTHLFSTATSGTTLLWISYVCGWILILWLILQLTHSEQDVPLCLSAPVRDEDANWKENMTLFIQSKSHGDSLLETLRPCLESIIIIYSSCSHTAPLESIRTLGPLLCPGTTIRMFWTVSASSQWLLRNLLI